MTKFTLPDGLKEALRNGQLIPFVGAGVSMSVEKKGEQKPLFPSWKTLLLESAEEIQKQGLKESAAVLIKAHLGHGDDDSYLEAAKLAQKTFGNYQWNEFLEKQLTFTKADCDASSLKVAETIWQLNHQFIITTNYDNVLKWACPVNLLPDINQWDIQSVYEQASSFARIPSRPTIWHLHGHIGDANNLIITPDGYHKLYGEDGLEEKYKTALASLKAYLSTHKLLFIGFSFSDSVFTNALKSVSELFDGNTPNHFVLIKENQRAKIEDLNLPLIPVTYENHDDLPELLNELSRHAQPSEIVTENTAPTTPTTTQNAKPDFDISNPVFNLPFPQKGDGVIGREEVLQTLRQQLTSGNKTRIGHAASFNGMGGLGKTQLAVEYAYRYKNAYQNGVMWIAADQDINNQLIKMAKDAKWFPLHLEMTDLLARTRDKLQNSSDCLIIFDNVETREQIQDYLPNIQVTPHLLITSRANINGFAVLPLDLLNHQESIELLLKEANRSSITLSDKDRLICQTIVETLGHLPLAIELAGAYLKKFSSITFSRYQTLLNHNLESALSVKHSDSFTDHQTGLFNTLALTEHEIAQSPFIKSILQLLSWSATASMSTSLMATLLEVPEDDLIEPLALGVELKLLSTTDNNRYAIHRLLKEIQRELHPLEQMEAWGQTVCQRTISWFEKRKENFFALKDYQAEIDHLENWQTLANQHQWPQTIALIWLQAYPLWHLGQYQKSEALLLKALDLFKQTHKEENKDNQLLKAHLLADLGSMNSELGKPEKALDYNETALAIRLTYLDEQHPDVATSYNNIGGTYGCLGQHNEALENEKKALSLNLELLGEKHPSVATSYNNIGGTYGCLGLHNEALENQQKALSLFLELLGDKHPNVASSYNNIGSTYGRLGQHNEALENQQKALNLKLKLLGEKHPNVASSYNNIGGTYRCLGQHNEALENEQKALSLFLELLGEKHPDVAKSHNNISITYRKLDLYSEALMHGKKAFEIRLSLFATDHEDLMNSMRGIITTLIAQKQFGRALTELEVLKPLAATNKKIKNEMLQLQSHIKKNGAKSGFRSSATKKTNKRKPKRR